MTRHLLVIGGQRCGSTLLFEVLDAHPDISMARPLRPEPKVFLSDELSAKGLDWYRATYFAEARGESVFGEKSTSYLEDPLAPRRARQMLDACDVIVQLRDPVRRAVSNWRFSTASGLEDRPLATALEENLSGARAWDAGVTSVSPFAYLERGRYIDDLGPWLEQFGSLVQVRFLEDGPASPEQTAHLYETLGVDATFTAPGARRVNASTGDEPTLDPELLGRLREYFAESDARLAQHLGRRLPWTAN